MSAPQIVFRVDGSARIGGGHVMRCLALAEALSERGAAATFVCAELTDALAERIADAGHRLKRIASPLGEAAGSDWDTAARDPAAQQADAELAGAAAGGADWLVVDHYGLDHTWETSVGGGAKLAVIDDLANRRHDCDLLIDQNFGASRSDYRALVGPRTTTLCGSAFAILRPEFLQWRDHAIHRRANAVAAPRLLLSLGATDVDGVTGTVLDRLLAADDGRIGAIDVTIARDAPSESAVARMAKRDSRVTIHHASERMAELMVAADLAIGAAGTSSWERCALGLPTVTLALAANQRRVLDRLAPSGAVIAAEGPADAASRALALAGDGASRSAMSAAAFALVDARGAGRIAAHMLARTDDAIRLRPAGPADSATLWAWRNDPVTRRVSRNTAVVEWAQHSAWFERVLATPETLLLIAEVGGEDGAMVRFDRHRETAEVSINLAPHLRGRGLAARLLDRACGLLVSKAPEVAVVTAAIRADNRASRDAFAAAGFVAAGEVDANGFVHFERR